MWQADPVNGSWRNVYSLLFFEPTLIPYQELRDALGSDPKDNFMGLRIIRDDREATVLDALGIATVTADAAEAGQARRTLEGLAHEVGQDALLPPEQAHTAGGSYTRTECEVTIRRVEALLVKTYEQFLPPTTTAQRIRCSAGLTDLYLTDDEGHADLLEAKSSARHSYVRQALGQILDYAHNVTRPVSSLTALFPERPASEDVALLHRYGVDCVFHEGGGVFKREAAPRARRSVWQPG